MLNYSDPTGDVFNRVLQQELYLVVLLWREVLLDRVAIAEACSLLRQEELLDCTALVGGMLDPRCCSGRWAQLTALRSFHKNQTG